MSQSAVKPSQKGNIESKLESLGIILPNAAVPAANYVPYTISGNTVYVSGQITAWNGEVKYIGKLGKDFTIEQGQEAAKICALNVIAHLRVACGGNLDRVKRCLKVGVFVNSTPEFTEQPQVANGASNIIAEIFGEAGQHARFAVGVAQLPRGVAVEVDGTFEIA